MTPSRARFLASLGALGTLTAIPARGEAAPAEVAAPAPKTIERALILSGGGARGSYEAGIVSGLADRSGIADGQILAPYGLVCGTSIGALNAWFVASGQYGSLRNAWHTLARDNIFQLKRKYAAVERPHAFIFTRIIAALSVASGLTQHEKGLAQTEPVLRWLRAHIDPSVPLLMPMVWAVTNLSTQSPEYFFRVPPSVATTVPGRLTAALRYSLGAKAVIRQSVDENLHHELLASAAVPIVFDPVEMPMADGSTGLYADGSIASNITVSVARTVARALDVVLVDPPQQSHHYENAIDITLGSYETMQRVIIENEMRHLYFESLGKKATDSLPQSVTSAVETRAPALTTLLRDLPAIELTYKRPAETLPADFTAFDQQDKLDACFRLGEADSQTPFTPYVWETFSV